ncbi:MAG: hypothetical protein EU530_10930 [Promethearchaeota archaeon]|nr:MAG: hypothetical protein EU530_10930 [Candidatus Lokiarchaeota archaeon]
MVEEAKKIQIFVFVPLSACGCNFTKFMDRMYAEFIPYNDFLDVQVKDIQGIEANSFLLFNNSVVVPNPPNRDKPLIFTSYLELRKFLKEIF